jgi:hypothetical protein
MPTYQEPDVLWAYDKLQFARLIAEAEAAGVWAGADDPASPAGIMMLDGMDLCAEELAELVDRARSSGTPSRGPSCGSWPGRSPPPRPASSPTRPAPSRAWWRSS